MGRNRLMGNVLGIFLLASALGVNIFSSGELKPLNTTIYFIFVFIYLVICLPLLFPLKLARKSSELVFILLAILVLDIVYFSCKFLKDVYWSLSSGSLVHQIATFLLGAITVFILVMQYSEIKK